MIQEMASGKDQSSMTSTGSLFVEDGSSYWDINRLWTILIFLNWYQGQFLIEEEKQFDMYRGVSAD